MQYQCFKPLTVYSLQGFWQSMKYIFTDVCSCDTMNRMFIVLF